MSLHKMARTNNNQKIMDLEDRVLALEEVVESYEDTVQTLKHMIHMQSQTIDNINMMFKMLMQQNSQVHATMMPAPKKQVSKPVQQPPPEHIDENEDLSDDDTANEPQPQPQPQPQGNNPRKITKPAQATTASTKKVITRLSTVV